MIKSLAHFKKLMTIGRKFKIVGYDGHSNFCVYKIKVCTVSRSHLFVGIDIDSDNRILKCADKFLMEYGSDDEWSFHDNVAEWLSPLDKRHCFTFTLEGKIV